MGILSMGFAKRSILKTSVNEDKQMVNTRKKNDFAQTKVQYNAAPRDLTQEQSFWDKGVMS